MSTDFQIYVERLDIVEKENLQLNEVVKKLEDDKMRLELYVADIVHDHKIKMDATRLKIKKIS